MQCLSRQRLMRKVMIAGRKKIMEGAVEKVAETRIEDGLESVLDNM
jgi:hypothetical protein